MISQTAEYALRAMVKLAEDPSQPRTAEALSDGILVPVPYLHKILRDLARAKLLKISRGRHGGFRLAQPPEKIPLLDIINAIAPIQPISECPLRLRQHRRELCPLHQQLQAAIETICEQFRKTTIADLLRPQGDASALCLPPQADPRPATESGQFSV